MCVLDQFGEISFHEAGDEFLDSKAEEQRELAFDIEAVIDLRPTAHRLPEHDLQMHGVAKPVADELKQLIVAPGEHALRVHRTEWDQCLHDPRAAHLPGRAPRPFDVPEYLGAAGVSPVSDDAEDILRRRGQEYRILKMLRHTTGPPA